jgi:hypothetical protein
MTGIMESLLGLLFLYIIIVEFLGGLQIGVILIAFLANRLDYDRLLNLAAIRALYLVYWEKVNATFTFFIFKKIRCAGRLLSLNIFVQIDRSFHRP